jgi:hypothetical protein
VSRYLFDDAESVYDLALTETSHIEVTLVPKTDKSTALGIREHIAGLADGYTGPTRNGLLVPASAIESLITWLKRAEKQLVNRMSERQAEFSGLSIHRPANGLIGGSYTPLVGTHWVETARSEERKRRAAGARGPERQWVPGVPAPPSSNRAVPVQESSRGMGLSRDRSKAPDGLGRREAVG